MGIDDLVNKGKDFLDQNKDKIGEALKSDHVENVSDKVLDAGADFVKKFTPDEHDAMVEDVRANLDKAVGSE